MALHHAAQHGLAIASHESILYRKVGYLRKTDYLYISKYPATLETTQPKTCIGFPLNQ